MTAAQLRYAARGCGDAPVMVVYTDDFGAQRVAQLDTAHVVSDDLVAQDYGIYIETRKALILTLDE